MQPTLRRFDGMWPFTVLHFHDGVVVARVDNGFFVYLGVGYIVYQCPADAASRTRIDKAVLWSGVKGVLAIYELWVQNNVALLTPCFEVGQPFPRFQVACACYSGRGRGCREVGGLAVVVAFGTKHTVDVTIFVAS